MAGFKLVQGRSVLVVFFLVRPLADTCLSQCLSPGYSRIDRACNNQKKIVEICSIPGFRVSLRIDSQMFRLQVSYVDGGMEDQEESGN